MPSPKALLDHVGPVIYKDDGTMSISFTVSGLGNVRPTSEE